MKQCKKCGKELGMFTPKNECEICRNVFCDGCISECEGCDGKFCDGCWEKHECENTDDTYCATYACDNCGEEIEYEIVTGTTIKEYLKEKKCDNCGCNIIQGGN